MPVVGLVNVTQLTALVAVHEQPDPVMIEMLPKLPVDGALTVVGDTLYEHCAYAGRASRRQNSASMTPQHRTIIGTLVVRTAVPLNGGRIPPRGA